MQNVSLTIENNVKKFRSPDYNYNFDMVTGFFQRWGKTEEEDPTISTVSPEILDMEVSINGCPKGELSSKICQFCYKGNTAGEPSYMNFNTFKTIFDKLPKVNGIPFVNQIAFGITSFNANPDLFDIMDYCRSNTVVPNVTISGRDTLTDEQVDRLSKTLGAVAFSIYPEDKLQCYKLINRFLSRGMTQVNIHFMISVESIKFAYEICEDIKNNPLLKGLNAIVFLGMKPKGRAKNHYNVLPLDEYQRLVDYCMVNQIKWGMDSCSSPRAEYAINESKFIKNDIKPYIISCCDRCESGNFSYYTDVNGKAWPCSFCENMMGNFKGIDMVNVVDFDKEVWNSSHLNDWRNKLTSLNRECPVYPEIRINK